MISVFVNEPIDVIRTLLENSNDGIIGIRIYNNDTYFTVEGFKNYLEPFFGSNQGDQRLDLRGPFTDNFVPVFNSRPRCDTYYVGRGDAIKDKLRAYLDAKEGTYLEKAAGMFKDVLHPYPVYTFKQMHVAQQVEAAHASLNGE